MWRLVIIISSYTDIIGPLGLDYTKQLDELKV